MLVMGFQVYQSLKPYVVKNKNTERASDHYQVVAVLNL